MSWFFSGLHIPQLNNSAIFPQALFLASKMLISMPQSSTSQISDRNCMTVPLTAIKFVTNGTVYNKFGAIIKNIQSWSIHRYNNHFCIFFRPRPTSPPLEGSSLHIAIDLNSHGASAAAEVRIINQHHLIEIKNRHFLRQQCQLSVEQRFNQLK